MLELLQCNPIVSGRQLANELGIDRRTVRRHVAQLESLGVPVLGVRGRDGGYMLLRGYRLPPMMFTNDEAVALVIGLQAASAQGLVGHDASAAAALAKIERVLPERSGKQMRSLVRALKTQQRTSDGTTPPYLLTLLGEAVDRQQRLELCYGKQDGTIQSRLLDAYGIVNLDRHWYVIGHCHLRGAIRSFRLDRILGARPLAQSFARPPGFDAMAYLRTSIRDIRRKYQVHIVIDGPIERVRQLLPPMLGILQDDGGRVRLTAEVDDLAWLARELGRLPFRMDISGHKAFRQAWASHVEMLATAIQA